MYTNGVARATPTKKSATPSFRLPPHHLAPYTGRPRIMKAPARAKERTHGQKVPAEAETDIRRAVSKSRLRKMLSIFLKTVPLTGRAPHRLVTAPPSPPPPRRRRRPSVQKQILALLVITAPLALRGAPPPRKRAPKANCSVPLAYNMLSQTCRAPLARRVPYRLVNAPLKPGWRTTVL